MLTVVQTIVGQVNSEFQGDVSRKIRLGAVSRLHGESAWEISGGKAREWARAKGFKVTSIAGGNLSNNSRAGRCVDILKTWEERCFSTAVSRTAVICGHWQSHMRHFATGALHKAGKCHGHNGVRKCFRESRTLQMTRLHHVQEKVSLLE